MELYQVEAGGVSFLVCEQGRNTGRTILLLHGWPEDHAAWTPLMYYIPEDIHVVAIDLPGIGRSAAQRPPDSKAAISDSIHDLVSVLKLSQIIVVGHDVGGQVAYSYLVRHTSSVARAVIMNVVVPGVDPWDQVERNPYIWHFRFHSIAELPETLVEGRQRPYFSYFYSAISRHPERITEEARNHYADSYGTREALTSGFNWYRAFGQDAKENRANTVAGLSINTPVLYLRGDGEGGDVNAYVEGFRKAGLSNVTGHIIADAGHFSPEENPHGVWEALRAFVTA